jgi:uncharacterized protein (TIGR00730 family)
VSTPLHPEGSALTAPAQRADEIFLEGPRSRFDELVTVLRVVRDFFRGFRVLHFVGPCVTVFGSARIKLPVEQSPNAYLDRCVTMHYFFVRKALLVKYSYAFVVMPGGAGTLDELFEALTLIQTGKIKNFPIVIMGTAYWKELVDFISKMAEFGMISQTDVSLVYATDSVEEAITHIRSKAIEPFGLRLTTRVRRHLPWLGERAFRERGG